MSRPLFRLAVLALLAVLVGGVAACGGDDDQGARSDADATALLRDTFGADHPIRSGRLDADLDVDLRGLAQLAQPLRLHLSGPFQSNGGTKLPDFALDVDFQGGEKPITVGAVFAQGGGFLTIEGQAFDLGSDIYTSFKQGYEKAKAQAARSGSSADQPTLAALGIAPLRWLKDPKNEGTEDIAGTASVHVSSGVDVGRLLEDISTLLGKAKSVTSSTGTSVPTRLTAEQRDAITRSITSARVDIWTGAKDHTLRKVAVDVRVDVPEELRAESGSLRTGHVIFQVTIADLNRGQTVRRPAGARPLSELRSALQQLGLLGDGDASPSGAGTGTTATTPGATATTPDATTTAPSAAAGAQADYAHCIAAAAEDLAKVQGCAKYLK
ncbi:MAG TPA: hypothetical protein VNT03_08225 [Baekduia sp.]|nr:hypothetical protein [Baekduia sp.]